MSFTPEQIATYVNESLRELYRANGAPPPDEKAIRESLDAAFDIVFGGRDDTDRAR